VCVCMGMGVWETANKTLGCLAHPVHHHYGKAAGALTKVEDRTAIHRTCMRPEGIAGLRALLHDYFMPGHPVTDDSYRAGVVKE
jgi:hypothetical protein